MKNTNVKIVVILFILFLSTGCTFQAPEEEIPINTENSQAWTDPADSEPKNGEKTGVWSPDSRWVAVTTVARTWIDTVILDTVENKEYETGIFKYLKANADKYDFKIGENQRPDPYVNFMEWCPDSQKVLLSYGFTDDDNIRQTGVVVFNLDKMSVDWLLKLPPAEGEHAEINKPEAFSWSGMGYGIEAGIVAKENNTEGTYRR